LEVVFGRQLTYDEATARGKSSEGPEEAQKDYECDEGKPYSCEDLGKSTGAIQP